MSELESKYPLFAKRLTDMMDKRGLDRNALSDASGVSYEMIRRYCEGIAKPRVKALESISEALGTTARYLEYGGSFGKKLSVDELMEKIKAIENGENYSDRTEAPYDTQGVSMQESSDNVPILSWVAAGSWSNVEAVTFDDAIGKVSRPNKLSKNGFALIVRGESMLPKFDPGDIIYVEPETGLFALKNNDLVIVQCNEDTEATFKQLVIGETSKDMYLRPLNPNWHEQRMMPMGDCNLVGKVVGKYVEY